MNAYLQAVTGSREEEEQQHAMQSSGVEIAPHVGEAIEREVLFSRKQRRLTPQARAKGFR